MRSRLPLALLLLPCMGFSWPGRAARLERALERGTPSERREAARLLVREPDARDDAVVLRALEDNDREVRLEAAQLAGSRGISGALPILLNWLRDPDAQTRASAARALGRIDASRAEAALLRAADDPEPSVRAEAVLALGRPAFDAPGTRRAPSASGAATPTAPAVVDLLARRAADSDANVRLRAVQALASLGDPRTLPALQRAAADGSAEVAIVALEALARSHDPRVLPMLTRASTSHDGRIALHATRAFGLFGRAEAVPSLAALLRRDDRQASAAIAALGMIDSDSARSLLVSTLQTRTDSEAITRALVHQAHQLKRQPVTSSATIASGLQPNLGQPAARIAPSSATTRLVAQLSSALHDARPSAKLPLAQTIAALSSFVPLEPAVPKLLASLPAAEPDLAAPLMAALARSAQPEVLPILLARLEQPLALPLQPLLDALGLYFDALEAQGRTTAARTTWLDTLPPAQRAVLMPWLGPEGRIVDRLAARLDTATHAQRVEIVDLLGRAGAPQAVPILRALRTEDDSALRLAVLRALGSIGATAANPTLVPLLAASDAPSRNEAALALRTTADTATIDALLTRLARASIPEANAILYALGGALHRLAARHDLTPALSNRALSTLTRYIAHPDRTLSASAIAAVGLWAPPTALSRLAEVLRQPASPRWSEAIHAIGHLHDPQARNLLHYVLDNASPREASAAATALGEIGDPRDLPALLKAIKRQHWPARGAAAFALVRLIERGVLKPYAAQRELCALLTARDPHVRTNALAGLARLQAPACPAPSPAAAAILQSNSAPIVRSAAAHWLAASTSLSSDQPDPAPLLDDCALTDADETVRTACANPGLPNHYEPAEIDATDRAGQPLPNTPISLQLTSGAVFLGFTDANGHLRLDAAPAGPLHMANPALLPLDP